MKPYVFEITFSITWFSINLILDNMNQVLENHVLENMFSICIMFSKKVYPISTQERDYKQKLNKILDKSYSR